MAHPNIAVSLVRPEDTTAANRRARKALNPASAPDSNPTPSALGYHLRGRRYLHVTFQLPDAGTSFDWELWLFDPVSELWCLDTRNGSGGTVSIDAGDADNPQHSIIDCQGIEKVFVKCDNGAGTFTTGANLWLGSSEYSVLT